MPPAGSRTIGRRGLLARRLRPNRRSGSAALRTKATTASPPWCDVTFEGAVAFALTLPDTELSTSYGQPAVKVVSNGRAFIYPSHEKDTSFGIAMDLDTIEMLKETEPETYWQTPHYEGWPGVLVRYDSPDEER